MQFSLNSIQFEIPWDVWDTTGMVNFKPMANAYQSEPAALKTSIDTIEPPNRAPGIAWFKEHRLRDILEGFARGDTIPPIDVDEPPNSERYRYRLRDGFHRFYASVAVGFRNVPVRVIPYFEFMLE